MSNSRILVTGANGQLGKELQVVSSSYPEFEFIFFSKADLSIHDADAVKKTFTQVRPDFCINCAAYTAVDKAESEGLQAFQVNGESTGILAENCRNFNTRFVHISTDYVFNGRATEPYKETDSVDPVNAYGASKLKGEELAFHNNKEVIVIRTSWVYSEFGNNFVKTMVRLMKERESLGVVNDQWGSPTYARDLAEALMNIITSGIWEPGVYHYSNEGLITWYDFATAIKGITNSNCAVNPITTDQFPTPAKRPGFSGFDKKKIRSTYNLTIPEWKESLTSCLAKLAE